MKSKAKKVNEGYLKNGELIAYVTPPKRLSDIVLHVYNFF